MRSLLYWLPIALFATWASAAAETIYNCTKGYPSYLTYNAWDGACGIAYTGGTLNPCSSLDLSCAFGGNCKLALPYLGGNCQTYPVLSQAYVVTRHGDGLYPASVVAAFSDGDLSLHCSCERDSPGLQGLFPGSQ